MTDVPTWAACAQVGMTHAEAAKSRGVSVPAAYKAAGRYNLKFAAPPPRSRESGAEWARLIAQGLTARQGAEARGTSMTSAYNAAKQLGQKWAPARSKPRNSRKGRPVKDDAKPLPKVPRTPADFAAIESAAMKRRTR